MAIIKESFGSGGANLTPGDSAGSPSLATALRDVADDVNFALVSANASDLATAITLVNEIKVALNATKKTTKG